MHQSNLNSQGAGRYDIQTTNVWQKKDEQTCELQNGFQFCLFPQHAAANCYMCALYILGFSGEAVHFKSAPWQIKQLKTLIF